MEYHKKKQNKTKKWRGRKENRTYKTFKRYNVLITSYNTGTNLF